MDPKAELSKAVAEAIAPLVAKVEALEKAKEPAPEKTDDIDLKGEFASLKAELAALRKTPVTETGKDMVEGARKAPAIILGRYGNKTFNDLRKQVEEQDPFKGLGLNFARCVRANFLSHEMRCAPWQAAEKLGYPDVAEAMQLVEKTLLESVLSAGGSLAPPAFSMELIPLLRAQAVVRKMGARTVPMPSDSFTFPRQTGGSTGAYIGEATVITDSELTTGSVALIARKLAVLTPVSNDLLRSAEPSADALVRDDIVRGLALVSDLKFIRGLGAAYEPKGIENWTASGNKFNATQAGAAATIAEVIADLWKAIGKLQDNNSPAGNWGWLMHPRSERYLRQLTDSGSGKYPFEEQMSQGRLLGFPFATTTQIPTNLGGGTNESKVYLVNFDEVIIGESLATEIVADPNGTWESGGTVYSGFSRDVTPVRAIQKHDLMLRHDESASVIEAVKWGA